jgi:putative thiamine transport system substrate-binding protein
MISRMSTKARLQPVLSSRRILLLAAAGLTATPGTLFAQTSVTNKDWASVEAQAKGQTVFFNAWAGSERINAYIQWAAEEVQRRHGVKVQHVKVADAADVVRRVRAEKQAGRRTGGSVDAVWINGENFLTMKREGLLHGPFAEALPSYQWVDTQGKPTTRMDFSEPVDGMEAPWGMAQFTWFADGKRVPARLQNMADLLAFAKSNPGRVSYPRPPDFHGTTFLKQLWLESLADRSALYRPYTPAALDGATAALWNYLDALHPHLWRAGRQFPQSASAIRQMMADGELLLAMTFNPNEAANEIAAGRLPASVVSWQPAGGSVGNTHFIAIPFNSSATAGAQVFINFLLSPEAQARKADISVWGDPTVLNVQALPGADKARFTVRPATGQVEQSAPVWPEPHGSWVEPLEREWLRRYGR